MVLCIFLELCATDPQFSVVNVAAQLIDQLSDGRSDLYSVLVTNISSVLIMIKACLRHD